MLLKAWLPWLPLRPPAPVCTVGICATCRFAFPVAVAAVSAVLVPASNLRRLSSIMLCISVLLLSNKDTFEPLMDPPVRIIPSRASSSVAKTMKASPCSPPTICTPPSGIVRPEKKCLMSMVPATMGRPCSLMTTAIMTAKQPYNLGRKQYYCQMKSRKRATSGFQMFPWETCIRQLNKSKTNPSQLTPCKCKSR